MKKYQVQVGAKIELFIEAENIKQAKAIAEGSWCGDMKYNGDFEIEDIFCYDEGEE